MVIVGLITLASSCDDFVDLEPVSQIDAASAYETAEDARLGVAGIYHNLQQALRGDYIRWGEARSDNYSANSKANANAVEIASNSISIQNNSADWTDLYKVISSANFAIDGITPLSFPGKNDILAQVHALRALAYFYAIRIWGDVPLFTEPVRSVTDDIYKPITSVDSIMSTVIIPDLLLAGSLSTTVGDYAIISRDGIRAILGDVYMWNRDYEKASEMFDILISSGDYSLVQTREEWIAMFMDEVSPEFIFSLKWTLEEDGNNATFGVLSDGVPDFSTSEQLEINWFSLYPNDSAAWVSIHGPSEADREEFADWRMAATLSRIGESFGQPEKRTRKYWQEGERVDAAIDETDIILYRYSDILLMQAEALNKLSDQTGAIDLLNEFRTARELPTVDPGDPSLDQATLEDLILMERQFEFVGEGKRYFDLIRTGKALEVLGPMDGLTNEDQLLWPIHFQRLDDNRKLVQNEAYK